jgi:hypothetical protein
MTLGDATKPSIATFKVNQALTACRLSMKAFQNLCVAKNLMKRLPPLADSEDLEVVGSLFLASIVRYGRPFTTTAMGTGSVKYPMKKLKK